MPNITGSASIEIEAPLAEVWAVVEDVASAPDWQNGMDTIDVEETDSEGRPRICETATDIGVRNVKSRVEFEYEPQTRVTWTQIKGDLKSVTGSWILEDLGDGRTKATYALDGDPGRVLGMLIRGPVEGKVREIIVEQRPGELKKRVEGS